jgi:hypothetical protein
MLNTTPESTVDEGDENTSDWDHRMGGVVGNRINQLPTGLYDQSNYSWGQAPSREILPNLFDLLMPRI